ncbi:MAG: hypothetical protein AB1297_08085 [bacterium]
MGRIVTSLRITNAVNPEKSLQCDALVDTGAAYMILPSVWKERLGELNLIEEVELERATQATVKGKIYGPVEIQIEGFRKIYSEVVFVDMEPEDGFYEPLIGYIVLEQSQAAVDMLGHRLLHIKRMDLKFGF